MSKLHPNPSSNYTTQSISVIPHTESSRPETFRLPAIGKRDPYFGLSRAHYYELEKDGAITLIRLRKRGKQRGVTLIPYDAIKALVQSQKGGPRD